MTLTLAKHATASNYYEGGHYELNMSFDSLRDWQWSSVVRALWDHEALHGPLTTRYIPHSVDSTAEQIAPQTPPPTATLTQHGQIRIGGQLFGCDVQATRSLFECVSVLVPVAMFAGMDDSPDVRRNHPELLQLDEILYDIALTIYDAAPFQIATIGYERGCQLTVELKTNAEMRHQFIVLGNALAQDEVLSTIEPDLTPYQEVRPKLRWLASKI
jgi:hypothetical protein